MAEKLSAGPFSNVMGGMPDRGLILDGGNISGSNLFDLQVNGLSKFLVTKTGRVGIGQSVPTTPFHVKGINTSFAENLLTIECGRSTIIGQFSEAGGAGHLELGYNGLTTSRVVIDGSNGFASAFIDLWQNTTRTVRIAGNLATYFNSGFNFGIGTITPSQLLTLGSTGGFGWDNGSGTADVILLREAANILAQRNSTAAQTKRLYNTYTDASNYERFVLDWTTTANTLRIGTENAGTGITRNLIFQVGGANVLDFGVTNAGYWTVKYPLYISGGSTFHNAGHIYLQNGYNLFNYGSQYIINNTGKQYFGVSSDVAIGYSASGVVEVNNGTVGTYRDLILRNITATGVIKQPVYTVSTLPSASTSGVGATAFVSDASMAKVVGQGTTVAGGGANKVPVYSDGTNWIID